LFPRLRADDAISPFQHIKPLRGEQSAAGGTPSNAFGADSSLHRSEVGQRLHRQQRARARRFAGD